MKRFLFWLLLLALVSPARAQTIRVAAAPVLPPKEVTAESRSNWQRRADAWLAPLDKTPLTSAAGTSVLYDRVAALACLDVFNLVHEDADTSDAHHFLQAYYELRAASYAAVPARPTREDLRTAARHYQRHDTVLLAALRYRLQYIDSNAIRNNQLRWESTVPSRLFDVAGRATSPYLLRESAVAAALADSIQNGAVRFYLPADLVLGNTGVSLQSAAISFGDGSNERLITPGQSVFVTYDTPGLKTLRYRLRYSDGHEFTTYSTLSVAKAACSGCRTTIIIEPCRIERFQASIPFQGISAVADVGYYYATTPAKPCDPESNRFSNVTKPVIVLDGIDHDDNRKAANLYGEYLFYIDANDDEQNLGAELRDAGYDVVVLNHPNLTSTFSGPFGFQFPVITQRGGSDYMERNAMALVELIQRLNRQMQAAGSTEKIAVVGPSMGGQVARYALAYMESQGLAHNTRLYLALDSPHNGATIPLSVQHFIKYFADETKDDKLVAGLDQLDSPAARELVQHHYSQGTFWLPHPNRTAFTNELAGWGSFPSQVRRVAVTNGALDGSAQRDQNGQIIREGEQALLLEQRGVPQGGFAGAIVRVFAPLGLVARLVTTAKARLYYGPGQGQTRQVLDSFLFGKGSHAQEAAGPAGSCGLDGAPGGYRNYFSEISEGNNSRGLFQRRHFYSVRDKACFIPMLSGVGYVGGATDNCASVANRDLVCSGETSFDAYYGPQSRNEEHVQLTPANVQFMRDELLRRTPKPVFTNAPDFVCPNGTAQFSVKAECSRNDANGNPLFSTTYTWTTSTPGLQIVSGQGTATVTVRAPAGLAGGSTISVSATRTGYAPSPPAVQAVTVESGAVWATAPSGPVCFFTPVTFTARERNTNGDYTWDIYLNNQSRNDLIQYVTGTGSEITVTPDQVGVLEATVSASDVCRPGQTTSSQAYTTVVDNLGGQICEQPRSTTRTAVTLYPNPATTQVDITLENPSGTNQRGAASFQVTLHDGQGRPVRQATATAGRAQLNTAALQPGLYHVQIRRDGEILNRQLSIQH